MGNKMLVCARTRLTFEPHINEKINTADKVMGTIKRTYQYIDEKILLLLYKALLRPHLDCANTVCNFCKIKDIKAIKNIQRTAARQIKNLKNLSYEQWLEKLQLPKLT